MPAPPGSKDQVRKAEGVRGGQRLCPLSGGWWPDKGHGYGPSRGAGRYRSADGLVAGPVVCHFDLGSVVGSEVEVGDEDVGAAAGVPDVEFAVAVHVAG